MCPTIARGGFSIIRVFDDPPSPWSVAPQKAHFGIRAQEHHSPSCGRRVIPVLLYERHLLAAVRYVSLNPVRAGLTASAQAWPWSSVRAHLQGQDDGLVTVQPVLDRVERFADLVAADLEEPAFGRLRAAESTGRPLGTAEFVADLERRLGRPVARRAPGRKPGVQAAKGRLPLA